MRMPNEKVIEHVRKKYPVGTRVELVKMDNEPQAPPVGTLGTVYGVDDYGDIMVNWDDESNLNVIYGVDIVRIVTS